MVLLTALTFTTNLLLWLLVCALEIPCTSDSNSGSLQWMYMGSSVYFPLSQVHGETPCNLSSTASGRLSAGTRVLNISEILNIILAVVEQPTTLAHLTQCYKLFLQPAPENLWHNVPNVAHLVWLIHWVLSTPVSIFHFISRPSV